MTHTPLPVCGAAAGGVEAVLFDLDGTLVDSARDLASAANRLRRERGLVPLPIAAIRDAVTGGTDAMLARALDLPPGAAGPADARRRFLDLYASEVAVRTRLFTGMASVLTGLEEHGVAWGIVTNKPARFTGPLLRALGLERRAGCVVCGDTTAHPKPHPGSLELAAVRLGMSPGACVYVGDAPTDVEAATAAGMRSIIARFGYLPPGAQPLRWGATHLIDRPGDLLLVLGLRP